MRISGATPRPPSIDQLISPRLAARLDTLDVRSNKIFAGKLQGERRSKRRGQSVEFDEHRQYTPGDDVRFIDWKALARLDKLFIKMFLEEQDLALHLAIDASASMDAGLGEPSARSKRHIAAETAMALGYIGLMKQNRVGVSVFGKPGGPPIARLPDTRGRHQVQRLASHLLTQVFVGQDERSTAATGRLTLNDALTRIAAQRVGKGVMVVISDFLDPDGYQFGLRSLAAAGGYDTCCIQTLTPGELDPETLTSAGGPGLTGDVRLTDVETGRSKELTVTPDLVRRYRRRVEAHIEQLRTYCRGREIDHVLLRTDEPVDRLVLDTLRRRGIVR